MASDAINTAFTSLQSAAGIEIIYSRGDRNVTVKGVPGSTEWAEATGAGYVETAQARDFLVRVDDLVLGGESITPTRGDTVTETVGNRQITYPVSSPGGSRVFSYADPYRRIYRIHTTETK
tara:strand:- start:879 stop:1241 length:363 start_codon:yes stop_codon:yes gene_type:complete